jgi:cytochrome bd ubiquinol oxidase subunit I
MVGIGGLMLLLVVTSWWLRLRHRLFDSPLFLRACVAMGPLGFLAVLAGWTTTEVGRQPWTVYGLLRTADSVPPSLTGGHALTSLLGYMAVYLLIFPTGFYVMARIIRGGPAAAQGAAAPIESGRASAPVEVELHTEGTSP